MYFADLTPYAHRLPFALPGVFNIGWIDDTQAFERGQPQAGLADKLDAILRARGDFDARVNKIRGRDPCPLCLRHRFDNGAIGSCELWLPALQEGHFFAAPAMIVHTVRDHGYTPPARFVAAVMACDTASVFNAQSVYAMLMEQCSIERDGA